MKAIFKAKWRLFLRNPWTFLTMTTLILIFSYVIGGIGLEAKIKIPVISHEGIVPDSELWKELSQSEAFEFVRMEEKEAKEALDKQWAEAVVSLGKEDFQIFVNAESPNTGLLQQSVQTAYFNVLLNERILAAAGKQDGITAIADLKEELKNAAEHPLFSVTEDSFRKGRSVKTDMNLQSLFGFTLFFVMYTIAYNVLFILQEKQSGVWDRIILSPIKKWQMYGANLLYSFLAGYIQVVLIFMLFRDIVGINFYGGFAKALLVLVPYLFCLVALSMVIVSFSKNEQHFNVLIPLISVSFGMLGGAFWPLEIVSSKPMLFLSKFIPITYGMEAMKMATVYQMPLPDLLPSLSVLLLMGVVFLGIGIHMMERRNL
jgi:ABC-2 type transporter.